MPILSNRPLKTIGNTAGGIQVQKHSSSRRMKGVNWGLLYARKVPYYDLHNTPLQGHRLFNNVNDFISRGISNHATHPRRILSNLSDRFVEIQIGSDGAIQNR